jgi:16S rRNA (cytosine967-C5)-methyltransferase
MFWRDEALPTSQLNEGGSSGIFQALRGAARQMQATHGTMPLMYPKNLLDHCAALLEQVLQFRQPADAVLSQYFRDQRTLGSRERATLAETVYSVLRQKNLFDALAETGAGSVSCNKAGSHKGSNKARCLAILGFAGERAFLQTLLTAPEQQWLATCEQARAGALPPVQRHNLPTWLADAIAAQVGTRFDAVALALLQQAELDVRVNTLLAKRTQAIQSLQQAGLQAQATPYSPWGIRLAGKPKLAQLDAMRNGQIEVQDEGSQLLAVLLDAKRGEIVVDFCAGAGGKTLALGAAMRNTGRLYALDVSAHRLEKLKPRLARSGLNNVHLMAIADESDERISRLAGKADRVLVDAPCSGLGTLRRSPDLKWRQTPQTVQEMAQKQAAILKSAARLLKPGGRLVYATCSVLEAENEAVAAAFTAAQPQFEPLNAAQMLEALKVPQAATLCSQQEGACAGVPAGQYLRLWPDVHGTDGFFAAIWQKKA